MSGIGTVVMVHPDDMNLADVKAKAAEHDATVMGNRSIPRGKVFIFDSVSAAIGA